MHNQALIMIRNVVATILIGLLTAVASFSVAAQSSLDPLKLVTPSLAPGQSTTLLPDGRSLLLGGEDSNGGVNGNGVLVDSSSGAQSKIPGKLVIPRSGHTATLLTDGTVLVLGGVGPDGKLVGQSERFDPATGGFMSVAVTGLTPRTNHTTTLLSDGHLLIAGGKDESHRALARAEIYTPATRDVRSLSAPLQAGRFAHQAMLLPIDGGVLLWSGKDDNGNSLSDGDLFDSVKESFEHISARGFAALATSAIPTGRPTIMASIPAPGAVDVPVSQLVSVRFSARMQTTSLTSAIVTLFGPSGAIAAKAVPAEAGLLLFVTPQSDLTPATRYTLFINGAEDHQGQPLSFTALSFTTASIPASTPQPATVAGSGGGLTGVTSGSIDDDQWVPGAEQFKGKWTYAAGRETGSGAFLARTAGAGLLAGDDFLDHVSVQAPPPLSASDGVTALSGQVLRLNGKPLADVVMSIGPIETQTDKYGRFLLQGVPAGTQTLRIDGTRAGPDNTNHGEYVVRVDVTGGQTTRLTYAVWLPKLDPRGTVKIPSPTLEETVVTTPAIPGLELRIPAGTVVRDRNGKVVTELNITAIPVDRPPFPLPGFQVPVYFTIQPGGAWLQGITSTAAKGARLIYPNYGNELAGARGGFWNYDAREKGWYVYGMGTVTDDRKQVIPDPGVVVYELTGAMFGSGGVPPATGPAPGCDNPVRAALRKTAATTRELPQPTIPAVPPPATLWIRHPGSTPIEIPISIYPIPGRWRSPARFQPTPCCANW